MVSSRSLGRSALVVEQGLLADHAARFILHGELVRDPSVLASDWFEEEGLGWVGEGDGGQVVGARFILRGEGSSVLASDGVEGEEEGLL